MAVKKFALSVTLPICADVGSTVGVLATGTLFEIHGRVFLVTARHVFDQVKDFKVLCFPEAPTAGRFHGFGDITLTLPTDSHVDIAVIEFRTDKVTSVLRSNWQLLSLDNVALPSGSTETGAFFVAGYPAALAAAKSDHLNSQFILAYTQMMPEPPDVGLELIEDGLDLFFDYARGAVSLSGAEMHTPHLEGVSGASLWEIVRNKGTVWSPETTLRVVGVQSGFLHSNYLRAKSWWAVAKVLERIDQTLAKVVCERLI